MARFEEFATRLLQLEGKYVNHPSDKGGATKYGVILSTWKEYGYDKNDDGVIDLNDIKLLTTSDAKFIAKRIFWDFFRADQIKNQSVAELIVDWGYNSGRSLAAKRVQEVLGLKADGIFGPDTLKAINHAAQGALFNKVKAARLRFIENLVSKRTDQVVFYDGWVNRINHFFFDQAPRLG